MTVENNSSQGEVVSDCVKNSGTTSPLGSANEIPSPNKAAIRSMVELLHYLSRGCDGSLVLVAFPYSADGAKRPPIISEFAIGDVEGMVSTAYDLAGRRRCNVYWSNTVVQEGVSAHRSWGKLEDAIAVIAQVIDSDADNGREGTVPLPPTLTLVTSSSQAAVNRQHVYFFDAESRPPVEEAVRQGELLRKAAQADAATGVVPHIYRLAGTLNWPTPNKIKRGRSETPQVVTIEGGVGEFVLAEAFDGLADDTAASTALTTTPARMSSTAPLSARSTRLSERHDIDGDRSRAACAFIAQQYREGKSHDEIRAEVLARPDTIGERYVRDGKDLDADIQRVIEKCDSERGDQTENRADDQSDMVGYFWRHRNGNIHATVATKDGVKETPVCTPMHILGKARDPHGGNWARVVQVLTPDGAWRQVYFDVADLHVTSGEREVVQILAREGLELLSPGAKGLLRELLILFQSDKRLRTVKQPGWMSDGFVLPSRSKTGGEPIIWSGDTRDHDAFAARGSLEEWIEHVAKPAVEHPTLLICLAAAFTGPLLGALQLGEGFGIHLHGSSSSGKTTAAWLAASAWGAPEKFAKPWRGTDNGLEAVAASRNHTLLVLDELNQVDPRVAHNCAYMLAQGQSKSRMTKTMAVRKSADWLVVMLSTGEESFADYLRRGPNGRAKAGQTVRMIDIPVPLTDNDLGVFRGIVSREESAAAAIRLKRAARNYHGTAGARFVELLEPKRDELSGATASLRDFWRRFATQDLAPGVDGQVNRVIEHLGLIFVAGVLASKGNVLPVKPVAIAKALHEALQAWIAKRGGSEALEEKQVIEAVQKFLGTQAARFTEKLDATPPPNRAGRRYRESGSEQVCYAILADVFRDDVCATLDHQFAARVLRDRGWLHCDAGRLTRKVPLDAGDTERSRCYCVRAEILEAE